MAPTPDEQQKLRALSAAPPNGLIARLNTKPTKSNLEAVLLAAALINNYPDNFTEYVQNAARGTLKQHGLNSAPRAEVDYTAIASAVAKADPKATPQET